MFAKVPVQPWRRQRCRTVSPASRLRIASHEMEHDIDATHSSLEIIRGIVDNRRCTQI